MRFYWTKLSRIPPGCSFSTSRADRELLHYYCCEAADSLSRFSGNTLWKHTILQRSQDQPVIRNSLVALSCLYRDYNLVESPQLEVSVKHIQLITRSHSQLRAYLVPDASAEVALICSLIFYTFECLIGNVQQALWHLDQGLIMLRRFQTDYPCLADGQESYGQLMAIFSQLDIHASIFLLERTPILRLALPEQVSGMMPTVPEEICGLPDPEKSLAVLQNWTLWHLMEFVEFKNLPLTHVPSVVLQERLNLESQLQKLEEKIEIMTTNESFQSFTSSQRQQLTLLRSQALIFHAVLLENIICTLDGADTPQNGSCRFDLALNQISTLLLPDECDIDSGTTPSKRGFTLSTNIIAMLYFICLKTNDRRILRTALSLMQGSLFTSRDGLWDARTAVAIVKAMLSEDDIQSEEPEMDFKLEAVGSGIVDTNGGLEETFKMLQLKHEGQRN